MADADARTPLLAPRSSRRRLVVVAGLVVAVFGVAALSGGPGERGRAPALLAAADAAAAAETRRVYEVLVEQSHSYNVQCEAAGAYALCGEATCSPAGEASRDVAACACRAISGGASAFEIGGSNVHLAGSAAYRAAVLRSHAAGALSDAESGEFCSALVDGTVCAESGFACDSISFHAGDTPLMRRRAFAKTGAPAGLATVATPTCMGAPCYARADDACAATCLCPTGSEAMLENEIDALGVEVVQETSCLTHLDDYAVVDSPGQLDALVADLARFGADPPTVAAQCAACTVSDVE